MTQPIFDQAWADAVCAECDPVFEAADVGFTRQVHVGETGGLSSLLWEADPAQFAARYPASGIVEGYGDQWPPPCIDYWIYVRADQRLAELSAEGWDDHLDDVPLTGDGENDGRELARVMARVLAR